MSEKWFKYDYVCSICDALIEVTTKSNVYKPQFCCREEVIWLSVVDATIDSSTKRGEEVSYLKDLPCETCGTKSTYYFPDKPTEKYCYCSFLDEIGEQITTKGEVNG